MDSMIPTGQKNTLVEYMILSGSDNRLPMLDKPLLNHGTAEWNFIYITYSMKYAELSASKKLQADCDLKAINIILQVLPIDVYALMNHHRISKDLWEQVQLLMQVNQQTHLAEFPQIDSGLAVLVFKQGDDPIDAINKMMSFLVTVQPVQERQSSFAAGKGHMARQCPKPKRKRDATWFRDKVLLVEAQGSGKVLNNKELEFLVAYQADDLDTYDSDYDDFSTAKAVLMANLSSYDSNVLSEKLEEKQLEEEQAAKAQNWKLPVCYDDDHDEESSNSLEDNIISELSPCVAIIPTEPVDSLSMGDEHLDTISATKSDEFIKSSVENLVLNLSESKGENKCDVPAGFTTFSNVLFDAEYDFDSSDNQSFFDEDLPEKIYSNPLFDEEIIPMKIDPHSFNAESDLIESMPNHDSSIIISSKIDSLFDEFAGELTLLKSIPLGIDETNCHPEEETHFTKRFLYDNSSPRPLEEFVYDNSDAEIESFSPSPIPVEDSDSFMEEVDLTLTPDDPMPPSIEEDVHDSERDIPILEELLENYSLSLPKNESCHFDIPSPYRPPAKPLDGNTGILNIKMMGDISNQKVPIPNLMITCVSSQDKYPDLLPHQGLDAFQYSAEFSMMINRKNTPILDTSHPNTDQSASSPVKIEAPRELPKITPDALTEGEWGFEHTKKEFLIENDRLLDQIISQEIVNIVVNSSLDINTAVNVNSSVAMNDFVNYAEMCNKCLELEAELIKQHDMVKKMRMYKLDLVTLAPKDKNNKETHIYYHKHTLEQAAILKEIVEHAKLLNSLDSASYSACKYVKLIQELLGYVRDTFFDIHKPSEKLVAVMPINKNKTVGLLNPS
nr:hypothetical protein [Tanacetum cinerariifolium]